MTSAPGSELADRALRGVARKLSRDLSVEYTVNELMREAKDTYNLANIFVGACRGSGSVQGFAALTLWIAPCTRMATVALMIGRTGTGP
jgi:hypothetical protein